MKHNLKNIKSSCENPLISIIIPVYKTPRSFLTDCLESIGKQTYKNLEIIIVNDGGDDYDFCLGFTENDKRVRVLNQKNSGVSAARNAGLKAARGTWCIFIDSDDRVEDTMCTDALKAAEAFKACTTFFPDVIFWPYKKEYAKKSEAIDFFKTDFTVSAEQECIKLHKQVIDLQSGLGSVWAKMYRLDFIQKAGVLFNTDLSLGEDIEFNFRLFRFLKSAVYIHKFNYRYRYDAGTVSNAFNTAFADKHELFAQSLYADIRDFDKTCQKQFSSLIAARIVHSILAIALRYCFHPQNPLPKNKRTDALKQICRRAVFKRAIEEASYNSFGLGRKAALFCLKNGLYGFIRLIAAARSFQYRVKNN